MDREFFIIYEEDIEPLGQWLLDRLAGENA
jgi:hypothetical protein